MKKYLLLPFLAILFCFSSYKLHAQCTGGTSGGTITMTTVWQSLAGSDGGRYYSFTATAGNFYYFSYCPADGGSSTYDTQITILDNTGAYAGGYNDDYCGVQSYLVWACPTTGTYRALLNAYYCATQNNMGTLRYKYSPPPTCPGGLGGGVVNVASLPYASGAGTTCGSGDDITASNATICGSSWYYGGEDNVWIFTPATTGQITITLTSTGSYTGLMLYQGCPFLGGGGVCVDNNQDWTGSKSMCANVTAGLQYYLVLDSWPAPTCNAYSNLTISAPTGTPAGATCGSPVTITLPYSATGETTACMGNDYTNASTGSCGSLYESGEDKVYRYVASGPECIGVTLSNSSTWSIGFQVYSGCPGSAGTTCVGNYGGSNPLTGNVVLPAAGTYYIIVDTWAAPNNCTYDISVTSYGAGPANDLPCNATALSLAVSAAGDNNCSGGSSEPATPACWWAGNVNTVWYKVVCPASGQLKITTTLGTLTDTQIGLYSGACGSLTNIACNDNANNCSGWVYYSEILQGGLTPGATYYVSVDGYGNLTGSFSIIAVDGAASVFYTNQDCDGAIGVCQLVNTVSTSYFGCGNILDVPAAPSVSNPNPNPNPPNMGCLLTNPAELNTVWYTINITTNGTLKWTLTKPVSGYYDWALWNVTSNSCADIRNNLLPPVRCNWNATSTNCTGMQSPIPACGIAGNFEAPLAVTAGQIFKLCLSNYSGTSGGYTLDFTGSTCTIGNPPTITWTGNTSTAWAVAGNWGGCAPPVCAVSAIIAPATNQPIISANATVNNLMILPGASLTINAGITLTVCGDYTNQGTLNAIAGSTILFNNGSVVHMLDGNMIGANKFANLTITKTGGSVITNQDVDIGGNFLTSNATSVFNTSGKYIKVTGNFTNAAAATTYTNVGTTGTLEFNGAANQNFTAGGAAVFLNNVTANQSTSNTITLVGNNLIVGTSGTLTLTSGRFITNALEVNVTNNAPAAVTTGNNTSYVEGFLRRTISTGPGVTGSFDFPVGNAAKGYQRANITFTSNTTIGNLLANFNNYASVPMGPVTSECVSANYSLLQQLDNGYWTINASSNPLTGNYDMTLYNRAGSYTNSAGASGWTVVKDPGTGWTVQGTCVISSTVNQVMRTGMNGFSNFGTGQSTSPLPIELVSFTGKSMGKENLLEWTTASEINNDYFTIEHSKDGVQYSEVVRVDGAGNSNAMLSYQAYDKEPYNGTTYYRLKQTDFDGNYSYSNVIAINNKMNEVSMDNVHPNPTNGSFSFDFATPFEGNIRIYVHDAFGRTVIDETKLVRSGKTINTINLETVAQGIYTLKVTFDEGNFSAIHKVVKN